MSTRKKYINGTAHLEDAIVAVVLFLITAFLIASVIGAVLGWLGMVAAGILGASVPFSAAWPVGGIVFVLGFILSKVW